ncbi:uncharacterized protein GGS22DRAFT_199973 [Annulohypoxylon maeteangense]|uniref:uncharacterized protein n=1 Tax=Annulohypoxylon maeteangense TaxID=1927788 RepID=UPI002008A87C|nr:uncharacterized protein GGS22DRAFT_199973 [Annulohypoxylon maeteangense]KAI0885811.1 hypothetical protein GGS22DRAFT_199973 [Annulohypoxylon maeteangense]
MSCQNDSNGDPSTSCNAVTHGNAPIVNKEINVHGSIRTGDLTGGNATGGDGGSAFASTNIFVQNENTIQMVLDDFEPSKIKHRLATRDDFLRCDLAPAYGQLTSDSVRKMDKNLKVMITATVMMIEKMKPEKRKWSAVETAFLNNSVVEPFGDVVNRCDTLSSKVANIFKVELWFHNLIQDADILSTTPVPITKLAEIVAWTGATITSIGTVFYKSEKHERTVVDIGILRFPDLTQPYFKVYHIELKASSRSDRYAPLQYDYNSIEGAFYSRKFRPREEVIRKMSPDVVDKAVHEANALFD